MGLEEGRYSFAILPTSIEFPVQTVYSIFVEELIRIQSVVVVVIKLPITMEVFGKSRIGILVLV
jgi:hypothetical protein